MIMSRILATTAICLTTATFAVAGAGAANAQGGGAAAVRAAGTCAAGTTTWHLKAKPDHGRIEVEWEVDTPRIGRAFTLTLTDNGVRVFSGTRVTTAPSGAIHVALRTANRAGADNFVGTARNTRTGQVCVAKVRL